MQLPYAAALATGTKTVALCTHNSQFPCGLCKSCLMNARRILSARIQMEGICHEHSLFSTFTYATEPDGGNLVPDHLSSTIHRLRDRFRKSSRTVRFFGIGEYGGLTGRPHYHAVIFGLGPQDVTHIDESWKSIDKVDDRSRAGHTSHYLLAPGLADYITGYVSSKLKKPDSPLLLGRTPEFSVMSRRPGIGMPFVLNICEALNTSEGALYLARHKDVPTSFICNGKQHPLGNYMRQKLRLYFFGDHLQPRERADQLGLEEHARILEHLPPLQTNAPAFEKLAAWTEANQLRKRAIKVKKSVRKAQVDRKHQIASSRKRINEAL